ncbi:MAG TPA: ribosome-associated translation inhibitor RaiA [Phycisphaerae bacterium]|nr:ribosome-associated translation inhibitor RaiA [Phycisphaerae bacterium]
MRFAVTGRHLEMTDAMKQYAEEKAGRLSRFYDRVQSAEVVVEREGIQYRVEMVVSTDHKEAFVGQVHAGDYYEALDLVVDKVEGQLRKHKEKLRNRKHRAGSKDKAAE